jgi:hypothetical protein
LCCTCVFFDWNVPDYIVNHTRRGHALGKPVFLGEFGVPGTGDERPQHRVYQEWGGVALNAGINADAHWMLSGLLDSGQWYPNYDGFGVYCIAANETVPPPPASADAHACAVLAAHAAAMRGPSGIPDIAGALLPDAYAMPYPNR